MFLRIAEQMALAIERAFRMIVLIGRTLEAGTSSPHAPASLRSPEHAINRHDGLGAFLVPLFSSESGLMVSPSGTWGAGST